MATSDDKPIFAAEWATRFRNFSWKPRHAHKVLTHQQEPLAARIARLRALHARSRLGDRDFFTRLISGFLTELIGPAPGPIVSLIIGLADENWHVFDIPDITLRSYSASEARTLTDILDETEIRIRYEDKIRERFLTRVGEVIDAYNTLFPEASSHLTVPLASPELIAHALLSFCDAQPDSILFYAYNHTREQLYRNMFRISGITPEIFEKNPTKVVPPDQYYGDVLDYVAGTALHEFFATQIPFVIPDAASLEHAFLAAPTGHGKSQLLQALVLSWLERDDPPPLFILDDQDHAKGILNTIQRLEVFRPEHGRLRDRLLIISPEDNPPLNFFAFSGDTPETTEALLYLFSALDASLGTFQSTLVIFVMRLMRLLPNPSIDTLRELMSEAPKTWQGSRYAAEIQQLDPVARSYFETEFYSSSVKVTKDAVRRRLYALMANPLFVSMFSAPTCCFDALKCMDERKIVLINASRPKLGADASSVFLRFFISQILAAAHRRTENSMAILAVDECGPHYDKQTERILSTARKYGLSFWSATQFLEQMDNEVKAAIFGNTAVKLIGPVSHTNAAQLAREMYTTPEFIRSMRKADRSHAEFACYVRGSTPQAVRVTVQYGLMEREPRMSDADHRVLRQRNSEAMMHAAPLAGPISGGHAGTTDATPRAHGQRLNEFSLRDTDLPMPQSGRPPGPLIAAPAHDTAPDDDPSKPGKW